MIIGDTEATDELIDKHASIMRIMENKKKTVEEFIVKGEKLMEDPKSPKFLETHVSKLKDAWEVGPSPQYYILPSYFLFLISYILHFTSCILQL